MARKDGLSRHCKPCRRAYIKAWKAKNPDKVREFQWKAQGIDVNEAWAALKSTSTCQLCGSEDKLVPDHCHETGKVRGVLCGSCNRALGVLGDTKDSIQNVLTYLGVNNG